jgi:sugar lactone lactonase YvrE
VPLAALTLGATYTVAVRSVNDAGESLDALSNPVLYARAPAPPTGVSAIGGNTLATVSWTAPTDTGGVPLTGFVVTAQEVSGATHAPVTALASARSINVSGLTNGVFHTFTVVARNAVGDSVPSTASTPIAPGTGPVLTLASAPLPTVLLNQQFPGYVDVLAQDQAGQPVPNLVLTFAVDGASGGMVSPLTATTGTSGHAFTELRAGRVPGPLTLTVTAPGAAPLTVTGRVADVDAGIVFPLLNAARVGGESALQGNGAGIALRPQALVPAPDGSLYFVDGLCRLLRLDHGGRLDQLRAASCATPGMYQPTAMVHDAARSVLYIAAQEGFADPLSGSISVHPLDGGTATRLVGLGGATAPGYGDGQLGTQATIAGSAGLVLSPDGQFLYFIDTGLKRIRRYEFASGQVTTALQGPSGCFAGNDTPVNSPNAWPGGNTLVQAPNGALLFVGLCNYSGWTLYSWRPGELRATPLSGSTTSQPGFHLRQFGLAAPSALALDPAGNLFYSDASAIWRFDAASGLATRVTSPVAADTGFYGSSANYQVGGANLLALDAQGDLALGASAWASTGVGWLNGVRNQGRSTRTPVALAATGGDGQFAPVGQQLAALTVSVTAAGAPVGNALVWWSTPEPGTLVRYPSGYTAGGSALTTVALGWRPGPTTVAAQVVDLYGGDAGALSFTATAFIPDAGLVSTVVNLDQWWDLNIAQSATGIPGPAAGVRGAIEGLLPAADGGLFLHAPLGSNWSSRIYRADLDGVVTSFRQPGALATSSTYPLPRWMGIDESRGRFFFAWNDVVRMLDLSTGNEEVYAGGGSAPGPGYGDYLLATSAAFTTMHFVVAPDGRLFIKDRNRIRVVDPVTRVVTPWLVTPRTGGPNTNLICGDPGVVWALQLTNGTLSSPDPFIAFDASDNAYVVASFCGAGLGLSAEAAGVLKVTPAGVITLWANTGNWNMGGIIRASDGALYWSDLTNRIYRIDPVTRVSTSVVGTGVTATGPELLPASQTSTASPRSLGIRPDGRLTWVENGRSVRVLW